MWLFWKLLLCGYLISGSWNIPPRVDIIPLIRMPWNHAPFNITLTNFLVPLPQHLLDLCLNLNPINTDLPNLLPDALNHQLIHYLPQSLPHLLLLNLPRCLHQHPLFGVAEAPKFFQLLLVLIGLGIECILSLLASTVKLRFRRVLKVGFLGTLLSLGLVRLDWIVVVLIAARSLVFGGASRRHWRLLSILLLLFFDML